jgi:hypothetical protein
MQDIPDDPDDLELPAIPLDSATDGTAVRPKAPRQ